MAGTVLVLDKDESLYRSLLRAAPGLRGVLVPCHQTAQAAAEVAGDRVAVLVAGPSSLGPSGLRFLQRARRERPGLVTLLVTGRDGPEVAVRDLVRTGAADIVEYPGATKTLRAALERAVEMAGVLAGREAGRGTGLGTAFTIASPSGGSGKTFFSTNLAYELAVSTGRRVALVDLDLQFGEVNTALRLRPEYTIHDLLQHGGNGNGTANGNGNGAGGGAGGGPDLAAGIADFMVRHESGIHVLAAPSDPSLADLVSAPEVGRVVQALKESYDYVVVDTPAALTEAVLATLDLSESLVVLATLDLPSVKNLGVFVSTLDRLKIPSEGISLVLNKAESDVGLSPADVRRTVDQDFKGVLPYAKEVSRGFNTGRPVLEWARHTGIGRALLTTFRNVVPDEPGFGGPSAASAPANRDGRLSRFLARIERRTS